MHKKIPETRHVQKDRLQSVLPGTEDAFDARLCETEVAKIGQCCLLGTVSPSAVIY